MPPWLPLTAISIVLAATLIGIIMLVRLSSFRRRLRPETEQRAYGGGNRQENWYSTSEALRWMLLMLCWSDYEAAVIFDIGWEDLQLLLDGKEAVPKRIWAIYMPCATMLRDDYLDSGHWPFPPRSKEDAPFVHP